jgi:hypothetical protein
MSIEPGLADRSKAVVDAMAAAGIERLVLASNGLHMIDLPNPVLHLTGFRSVGPCFVRLEADGTSIAIAAPADDGERVERHFGSGSFACGDPAAEMAMRLAADPRLTGTVGFGALPHRLAGRVRATLADGGVSFDKRFYHRSGPKTVAEIARARRATQIAEQGYEHLKRIARPGMRECDLAVDVNLFMKEQGADDCFLMLSAGPRSEAVMPSSERPMESGDLILAELSPSVDGQFVQICRTVCLGDPPDATRRAYDLLVGAMSAGIARVRPGRKMGDVCRAVDDFLSEAGYAQYSRPPFIRRRGHGLGGGSTFPGDVAVDNETILKEGMLFIVHPNQYLPETGYMMCGDPLVVGRDGPILMSGAMASLASSTGEGDAP